ncbi:type VI secretion system lipoprotein TssJ [Pseudomonas cannabina]|uniref:TssJ n=3 Tax=Pseudomonas syringae group TaxID=136849 RepID=I0BW07_PSECA|nr:MULTISPECIES: type VI secretion system lipoprotein TssJ [Pseudomonas syringae group]AFH66605.1 TssJ [Pseudomonas cannabina]KPB75359.1 TssJ [Pseudomonas syringae pv. maculicola]KPW20239.1 TssJ [Pseudomonas cannabina pv. alisalensis]MBM0140959.1 type VI secretion system lipoprotein TssJ [Pseudomonas cannabina pv. alisalensis]QHE99870.1 type VI secretion system lipoprotein TssJ [Pseudomonas syringae pv. maculicola str. ES4326]
MFRSVVSAALTVLLLGACAKDVQTPKDASVSSSEASVTLDFQAAAGLNPGATGQAAPVRVRLYELKNTASFLRADYFALAERAPATLGPDLLDQDEVLVQPGAQQRVVRHLDPATRHIGLVVGYRAIDRAQWRAVIDVSPRQSSEHRISLDVQAVRTDVATPTRPAQ